MSSTASSRRRGPRPAPDAPRPGRRGWRHRAGGAALTLPSVDEFRASTMQVCGLWPYAGGSSVPTIGVPMGHHLHRDVEVCFDPVSWFQRAGLISQPSVFFLGSPGIGKSSAVGHMITGLEGYGVLPLVLGDLRPDYVALIKAMNGQVISVGPGRGRLNVLDPGEVLTAADRLTGAARDAVLNDYYARRHEMLASLITISRGAPPTDREESIVDRALRVLDERHRGIPILPDLLQVIRDAPEDVRAAALDRGDINQYRSITENLEATLVGLTSTTGRLGGVFAGHTTTAARRDRPLCYDVSSVGESKGLQAATLLACWAEGFGMVNVANALADAGLEPRRHYFVVLDELWRALRAGRGLVDRADVLTRLNRGIGVGTAMISHTISDLEALPSEEDRLKALGFIERSAVVVCGGLPRAEMPKLTQVVPLSKAEQDELVSWSAPPSWNPDAGVGEDAAGVGADLAGVPQVHRSTEPPGRGKFLIKVGGHAGIPFKVRLTSVELALGDTNAKWRVQSRYGPRAIEELIEAEGLRDVVEAEREEREAADEVDPLPAVTAAQPGRLDPDTAQDGADPVLAATAAAGGGLR